jgi:hypothetical protein
MTFTVTLNGNASSAFYAFVNVEQKPSGEHLASSADFTTSSPMLAFSGTDGEQRTVTATINNDNRVEFSEQFQARISMIFGSVSGVGNTGIGTITNDDSATISLAPKTGSLFSSGEDSLQAQLKLVSSAPVDDLGLTVDWWTTESSPVQAIATTSTVPGDFVQGSGSVLLAQGSTGDTISVALVNDTKIENLETFNVHLGTINSGLSSFLTTGPSVAWTITSEDVNSPPQASAMTDLYRWAENDDEIIIPLANYFSDANDAISTVTFSITATGTGTGAVANYNIDSQTNNLHIDPTTGIAGIANLKIRGTDPYGAWAETDFDITSISVDGIDLEIEDAMGAWDATDPNAEIYWVGDKLRWTAEYSPYHPVYAESVSWLYTEWDNRESSYEGWDSFANAYNDNPIEAMPSVGHWAVTPAIVVSGVIAYLAAPKEIIIEDLTVAWQGHEHAGDGATNFNAGLTPSSLGGGDVLFAERNNPVGRENDELHNQLELNVTLAFPVPAGRTAKVWLKLFDPDHYSDDPDFDPLGIAAPWDNIDSEGELGSIGASLAADNVIFSADEHEKAVIVTVESRQPTNNFIGVGHPRKDKLDKIAFDVDGKSLLTGVNGAELDDDLRTEIVSIWRRLYIERDTLEEPDYEQGPNPGWISSGGPVQVLTSNTLKIFTPLNAGSENQFRDGRIVLVDSNGYDIDSFRILENTVGLEPVFKLDASTLVGAVTWRLLHDDDVFNGVTAADMVPDTSLWQRFLQPAMILVDTTRKDLNPDPMHAADNVEESGWDFVNNLTPSLMQQLAEASRQSVPHPDFWTIQQFGAFQGPKETDGDGAPYLHGRSLLGPPATAVFRETIADYTQFSFGAGTADEETLAALVSAHEGIHQFGLIDGPTDGTLYDGSMDAADTPQELAAIKISGAGLKKVISCESPGGQQ